jgi:hypothetical protein
MEILSRAPPTMAKPLIACKWTEWGRVAYVEVVWVVVQVGKNRTRLMMSNIPSLAFKLLAKYWLKYLKYIGSVFRSQWCKTNNLPMGAPHKVEI